jgi:hypothetical protein
MKSKAFKRIRFLFIFLLIAGILYLYSPYKVEGLGYYNKIWAHRVNSIEKLEGALKYYEGVELDLIYNPKKDVLDVNHTPGESIDLNFETYLKAIEPNDYPYLWLDIKKLDQTNADLILNKLLLLFKSKKYPLEKVLIETQQPEVLPIFDAKGFKTSYYLSTNLYLKKGLDLEKSIVEINAVIKSQPNISISTDYRDYKVIKHYFPKQNKYVWAITGLASFGEYSKIRDVLKDETVSVVLLKYRALQGNR